MLCGVAQDLTDDEHQKYKAMWEYLFRHTKPCGSGSTSPCLILKEHRDKYRRNCGGERPAVIAFAYKYKKLPKPNWWIIYNQADDSGDQKVEDEKKGNDKEEMDDGGDVELKDVSDVGRNDGKKEADDNVIAVDGVDGGNDDDEKKKKKQKVPTPEFSHLCGARDCIEPSHIVYEWKKWNLDRNHCHFIIRKFERKHRRDPRTNVRGMINVAQVRLHPNFTSKRKCTHGDKAPEDQPCFVNFGSTRLTTRAPVVVEQPERPRRSNRKGHSFIVNGQRGWIRAIDGNGRILFCVKNGRSVEPRWVHDDDIQH